MKVEGGEGGKVRWREVEEEGGGERGEVRWRGVKVEGGEVRWREEVRE